MDIFLEPFVIKALVTGMLMSSVSCFLGCIITWKRMACFGDSIAHGIVPGVVIGFIAGVNLFLAAFITALVMALGVESIKDKVRVSIDTVLIIASQAMLALGIVLLYILSPGRDLMSYLLGDILAISVQDLAVMGAVCLISLVFFIANWRSITLVCLSEEIAISEGVRVKAINTSIMLVTAAFCAFAMQNIGILLASSMLLMPAMAARMFSGSSRAMPAFSFVVSVAGVVGGIAFSCFYDVPTSALVVLCLCVLLSASVFFSVIFKKNC